MSEWVVIAAVAAGTWLERASLMLLLGRVGVPRRLERMLRYVGPSVMAALAVPPLMAPNGAFDPVNLHIPAALVAGLVAWRTHSVLLPLVAGLSVFIALTLTI